MLPLPPRNISEPSFLSSETHAHAHAHTDAHTYDKSTGRHRRNTHTQIDSNHTATRATGTESWTAARKRPVTLDSLTHGPPHRRLKNGSPSHRLALR